MAVRLCELVQRPAHFIKKQVHDFKVIVTQNALNSFSLQLSKPYDSIFIMLLGANAVQLGFLNTIFMICRSLIATPVGWLADRYNLRRIFLAGVGLFVFVPLIYALAHDWQIIITAMILYALALGLTFTACSVVCAGSLNTLDRATGKNFCNFTASVAMVLAPVLGSFLVTMFGGLTLEGIRSIYWIQLLGYGAIFVFIMFQFKGSIRAKNNQRTLKSKKSLLQDFREIFGGKAVLKRWLLVSGLIWMPYIMVMPYTPVFAHEFKGADQYTLGLMISAIALIQIFLGIPIGRLADRFGRKKIIYIITPFYYASNLILILAPSPPFLLLVGFLQGFYMPLIILTETMTSELVPINQMGRWMGVVGLFQGLFTIPAPLIGGLIWTHINPAFVFLFPVILDVLLRIPILATVPETLNSKIARSQTEHKDVVT
ncbi:MAG: MFS transporter [Candidatus Heimdallarchaeota archaeon]